MARSVAAHNAENIGFSLVVTFAVSGPFTRKCPAPTINHQIMTLNDCIILIIVITTTTIK